MAESNTSIAKRKRSPSPSPLHQNVTSSKRVNAGGNPQLSINYLARQSVDDLPLVSKDDTLPNLLNILSFYSSVLDRHESLASNLGARPLGPILIKRFERCFDSPPKILHSHRKSGASDASDPHNSITWLEVIEFARSHPSQFTLGGFADGTRVCQFYYPQKQLRVQITEEDFIFINSGRCQELIPPLPIWEDEEKEVVTCDVLEAKLKELTNAADAVAARTRQLGHRLKGRRAAILERRAEGGSGTPAKAPPSAAAGGFPSIYHSSDRPNGNVATDPSISSNPALRSELLKHFESLPQNQRSRSLSKASLADAAHLHNKHSDLLERDDTPLAVRPRSSTSSLSEVGSGSINDIFTHQTNSSESKRQRSSKHTHNHASNSANSARHNFSRPLPPGQESSQPYRPICQSNMDSLPRGARVVPPCDRCRRLKMECLKNLTSCSGCTKKHARCHWKDVTVDEVASLDGAMDVGSPAGNDLHRNRSYSNLEDNFLQGHPDDESEDDESNPLEDLEALGAKEDSERENAVLERQKQDEEGLRQARELARMGYEEGFKDVGNSDTHPGVNLKDQNGFGDDQDPPSANPEQTARLPPPQSSNERAISGGSDHSPSSNVTATQAVDGFSERSHPSAYLRNPNHVHNMHARASDRDLEATTRNGLGETAHHAYHAASTAKRSPGLSTLPADTGKDVSSNNNATANYAGFRAVNAASS